MNIEMQRDKLILLSEVPEYLPVRVSLATCRRWQRHGVRGIKLETVRIGGRRYTSQEALERFCSAITSAVDSVDDQEEKQKGQVA